jgi:azurin
MRALPFVLAAVLAACSKPVELTIASVGDTMAYDKPTLTVKAGQKVHLVLQNNATRPEMTHNWVLVKPGTEASVASAGQQAGESQGYVALTPDILAKTTTSKPGGTVEVTFTAPDDKGNYPYICTLPGHYQTMKGTLIVE